MRTRVALRSLSRIQAARSGRLTIIVVQQAAQPMAAVDGPGLEARLLFDDQPIAQALVVPFVMVVLHKFMDGPSQ